jgi:GNAT superfamily N-acetyltransferase
MYRAILLPYAAGADRFCTAAGLPPVSAEALARQRPDGLLLLADATDRPAGRAALWWRDTPPLEGQRLGLLGHYFAIDADAAATLLSEACAELTDQGCTLAVGPMDGNTWQRYRLVTARGSEPPFFLEPDNPDDWPGHFTANGFTELARYHSALNTDLGREDPRTAATARRVAEAGITLRPLRLDRFEEELQHIHALSLAAFRDNFLYTPISLEDFLTQYSPVRRHVRPELVLLAERDGQLVGYLFALPDLLKVQRCQPLDTVILKTVAVHPDHGGIGLGGLLVARVQEAARRLGFRRAIHALIHEANRSGRISGHTAAVFRRYALFARPLGQGRP